MNVDIIVRVIDLGHLHLRAFCQCLSSFSVYFGGGEYLFRPAFKDSSQKG
jgi:hypothetical protein